MLNPTVDITVTPPYQYPPFLKAVKADVQRYYGNYQLRMLIYLFLFDRAFRPIFSLRLCQSSSKLLASWLLDLTAAALHDNPDLGKFAGRVSDSGEGRWTVQAAVESGVPATVIAAALFARFSSRGEADFGDRALSAMRYAFGGHLEKHGG